MRIFNAAVTKWLGNGQKIGSRLYEFLAWSNSQLRDHGCWLFAADSHGNTSESIRRWMGDFSGSKTVPKLMARMGQCFSQTDETVKIPLTLSVFMEDDIERGVSADGSPYNLSDGIGRISVALAQKVCTALGLSPDPPRSAYQFRYSGFKGVLALDPTLPGEQVMFRDSQKKFDSDSNVLEIAKVSQPGRLADYNTETDHLWCASAVEAACGILAAANG